MPEMEIPAPKTPVYDVLVWLHEDKSSPITVAYKMVKSEATRIATNVSGNLSNVYWYTTKEKGDDVAWFNKKYVVRCEVTPTMKEIYRTDGEGWMSYGWTNYEQVYLEDLENEND